MQSHIGCSCLNSYQFLATSRVLLNCQSLCSSHNFQDFDPFLLLRSNCREGKGTDAGPQHHWYPSSTGFLVWNSLEEKKGKVKYITTLLYGHVKSFTHNEVRDAWSHFHNNYHQHYLFYLPNLVCMGKAFSAPSSVTEALVVVSFTLGGCHPEMPTPFYRQCLQLHDPHHTPLED